MSNQCRSIQRKSDHRDSARSPVARLTFVVAIAVLQAALLAAPSADARAQTPAEHSDLRQVDLVIALDVSGSMSGLIASAKQRLWDVVNELGRAEPQPELRVAILTFGNPGYGSQSGYVRIDQPFTTDLDAVNRTLFGFGTNGGDEYVARAVSTAVGNLDWSAAPDALRVLFVAGNEPADQDPQISLAVATGLATSRDIVVNTIYCGSDNDPLAEGWRQVASLTDGLYASIDQDKAAVAVVTTPMDAELVNLNRALNDTYLAYGKDGDRYRSNQLQQDSNAGAMSDAAAASRAVTKASGLYDASEWDLVDAVAEGASLDELKEEELPAAMQTMSAEERERYVQDRADRRDELQREIAELDGRRRDYLAAVREEAGQSRGAGLDDVLKDGLRALAEEKGFSFD